MSDEGALIDRIVEHAAATARARRGLLVGLRLRGGVRADVMARVQSACVRLGLDGVEVGFEEGPGETQLCAVEMVRT